MNRVRLTLEDAKEYFEQIKIKSNLSYADFARSWKINPRTLRDWKKGKYTFPEDFSVKIGHQLHVYLPLTAVIINETEMRARAGKIGGIVSIKKYGNPGTAIGRSKGGIKSLATHQRMNTGFKIAKVFSVPQITEQFAEFIGIMLGDGGITKYQIRITLNKIDDKDYISYVRELINKIFQEYPLLEYKKGKAVDLVVSGKNLVQLLLSYGLVKGDKIKQQIQIPLWINNNNEFRLSVLRGLFDTDGSVYLDKHYKKEIVYKSICIAYTSYSAPLRLNIYDTLRDFGFSPTVSTKNRIMLRKREDVVKFFDLVKSNNKKHLVRYAQYLKM